MKTWLIYPPFADPTQPYLSLPYLKGALRARGLDATVVDLNVRTAHYLLGRAHIEQCARKIAARFALLDSRKTLTRLEQMEYLALADARPAAVRLLKAEVLPVEIFQDPRRFYDFKIYRQARHLAEDALTCTSAAAFPYRFHFNQAVHVALPWGTALLEKYFQQRQSPLDQFYREVIVAKGIQSGDVVGLNLTFISQIPEVFYLAQLLRQTVPELFIIFGGSCLQQILAHADESARRWIVSKADAACVSEGEQTLPKLLETLDTQWPAVTALERFERLKHVPNLLIGVPENHLLHQGPPAVADLKQVAKPDYSDLNLDAYLAPERTLLFAPTRGCYWNRCAFCDYGLNQTACHGYREMEPAEAARQLMQLSQAHGVRNFYLSVDVMAPKFAEALATALVEMNADIRWSADFRIEKYFSSQRCELLFQSGLRAVAFGVESGSDRMLRQMNKGIDVATIRAANVRFHQAGIATAWMTFSHHPQEKEAEALQTARLIAREQNSIDLFILGRFGLTSGSDIAARPQYYGLGPVFYCRADDFRLFPLYEELQRRSTHGESRIEDEVARLSQSYFLDHYPWAGAISTHHSFLYFLKFGQGVFKRLQERPVKMRSKPRQPLSPGLAGLWQRPKHNVARLRAAQEQWMETFWQKALAWGDDGCAPLDEKYFMESLNQKLERH
ncbi:MAG: radical SAM protein [Desulfobacteraceae bacterium]|nr:radical SAM protein [Desulfobacteraceae bacterium]